MRGTLDRCAFPKYPPVTPAKVSRTKAHKSIRCRLDWSKMRDKHREAQALRVQLELRHEQAPQSG